LHGHVYHSTRLVFLRKKINDFVICFSESADHLVGGNGKFEEIIACSQEIAAATAQLVAASNVRKYL
jgi:hypothetical protein